MAVQPGRISASSFLIGRIAALANTTCQIRPQTGSNSYGEDTYAAEAVEYKGYLIWTEHNVKSDVDELEMVVAIFHISGDQPIKPQDKIILPDGQEMFIAAVQKIDPPGEGPAIMTTVYIGRAKYHTGLAKRQRRF